MKLPRLAAITLAVTLAASVAFAQKAVQLPAHQAIEADSDATIFPHITMGNGWTTKILLFNVTNFSVRYRLEFYNSTGISASIKLRDRAAASNAIGTLLPGASVRLETDNPTATGETQFWAALREGGGAIGAVQTFEWTSPDGRRTAATFPISDNSTDDPIFVPFDNMNGNVTALVLTNSDNESTPAARTVLIEAFNNAGTLILTTTRVVPAGGKPAFLLGTEYPELANRQGLLRIRTQGNDDGEIAVLALQADDQGNISAVVPFEGFQNVM